MSDSKSSSPMEKDKLEAILSLQDRLNKRVSVSFEDANVLPTAERVEWVDKMLKAISNEMEEIRNELPWKWWKPVDLQKQDWDAARKEWIDLFHFVLALGLVLGFPPDGEKIFKDYLSKNGINHDRQEDWKKDAGN